MRGTSRPARGVPCLCTLSVRHPGLDAAGGRAPRHRGRRRRGLEERRLAGCHERRAVVCLPPCAGRGRFEGRRPGHGLVEGADVRGRRPGRGRERRGRPWWLDPAVLARLPLARLLHQSIPPRLPETPQAAASRSGRRDAREPRDGREGRISEGPQVRVLRRGSWMDRAAAICATGARRAGRRRRRAGGTGVICLGRGGSPEGCRPDPPRARERSGAQCRQRRRLHVLEGWEGARLDHRRAGQSR